MSLLRSRAKLSTNLVPYIPCWCGHQAIFQQNCLQLLKFMEIQACNVVVSHSISCVCAGSVQHNNRFKSLNAISLGSHRYELENCKPTGRTLCQIHERYSSIGRESWALAGMPYTITWLSTREAGKGDRSYAREVILAPVHPAQFFIKTI